MPFNIDKEEYRRKFESLNCCVLIPTYNNSQTLFSVINEALYWTTNIIVINDGSTDNTSEILNQFPKLQIHSYAENKGKGYALQQGLKLATEKNFTYAISIDSDGQHYVSDIPVFIFKIEQAPNSLLVGARNLRQDNMPKKNTFGNKFSNFWFRFQTHIKLPDTQSGYRLYPLNELKGIKYFCNKYEFEIEIMVKAAWKGINIEPVPIRVFYAEEGKRVSHFRPFKDFTRISILNTYLTVLALCWHKPKYFFKNFTIANIRLFLKNNFVETKETKFQKSVAVSFGVFMGIIPIWGYQFVTALILAHILKMNKAIVGLAANISVPPMIPILLYGSLKTGQLVLGKSLTSNMFRETLTFETIRTHLFEYIIGSIVFAIAMAVVSGIFTFVLLNLFRKK